MNDKYSCQIRFEYAIGNAILDVNVCQVVEAPEAGVALSTLVDWMAEKVFANSAELLGISHIDIVPVGER